MKHKRLLTLLLLLAAAAAQAAVDDGILQGLTEPGALRVELVSELRPLVINRMHNWTIRLSAPDGTPVDNATFSVQGGMPLHNHGLPTQPLVTRNLGEGEYLLEGMRFHMPGQWELLLQIDIDGAQEVIRLAFEL